MDIAVMGYGVVGSGVVEVFYKNHPHMLTRTDQKELEIKYILDRRTFPDSEYRDKFIQDFSVILQDPDVRVVVETMGGLHPAYEFVTSCLQAGKSVVTSNKELVAEFGWELLDIAKKNNVNFLFEASVGGGIPVLRPISQCLAANEINEIAGILNGTTNFILTKMFRDKMAFDDALALAQRLGYAEKDPTADIEGQDACRKVCILAALSFGQHVFPHQVYTEGITKITQEDVEYASAWGGVIKLLGQIKLLYDGRISAMVAPAFVQKSSQLASVEDVFNAILIRGDAIGDVVFYGQGAGKLPTASAVVADVLDSVKHIKNRRMMTWEKGYEGYVADFRDMDTSFYVRGKAEHPETAKEEIQLAFPGAGFLSRDNQPEEELAFVTPVGIEGEMADKLETIAGLTIGSIIRVTDY